MNTLSQHLGERKVYWITLLSGPLLFLLIAGFFRPADLSRPGVMVLASTVWVACWWMTEVIPVEVTSLVPLILLPLSGAMPGKQVAGAYADSIIFLFMGGFILALALEKWGLHRRIALGIISKLGSSPGALIGDFMLATAFLSMWISNTATAMMMLPIASAVILRINELFERSNLAYEKQKFARAIMLGIGYSASIGGLATLIGTPPNMILVGVVKQLYGVEISFGQWMLFGVPLSLILLVGCWIYLIKVQFRGMPKEIAGSDHIFDEEWKKIGRMKWEEKIVLLIFVATSLAWISRTFLLNRVMPHLDDTIIVMIASVLLFIIPARNGSRLLEWKDAHKLPWGVLLVFGGGLCIAKGFMTTGLSGWIGKQLTVLSNINVIVLVLVIIVLVMVLTEFTSNTATATMILPILALLAHAVNVHPYLLMVPAAISSSCAFMFPVATPPNAIVFSTGHLHVSDMVKVGFWLNLFSVLVILGLTLLIIGTLWHVDLHSFPQAWVK